MPESLKTRLLHWRFNFFPAYRGTGARITYIADDFPEVRVKLPLSWRTRNYVGTIFGGSMYGAPDPVYMVMLIRLLGPGYVVWDKQAAIEFNRPARSTLYASFALDDEELESIRAELSRQPSMDRVYHVDLLDENGVACASVEKTIHIRRKADSPNASEGR